MSKMSLRVTMTIGLAAAATTISLLAHAETLHQNGYQYDSDVVRFKKTKTFLLGEAPQRPRLTVFTPQARPQLSVRVRESVDAAQGGGTKGLDAPAIEKPASEVMAVPAPATQGSFVLPASAPPIDLPPVREPVTERTAGWPASAPSVAQTVREKIAAPLNKPAVTAPAAAALASDKTPDPSPCSSQTVHFKWASTWVSPKTARDLVTALTACGAKQVIVTGFTCDLGSKAVNDKMALGRAEVVANLLRKAGFDVIQVKGLGETNYVGSNPDHRDNNRRVEVTLAS